MAVEKHLNNTANTKEKRKKRKQWANIAFCNTVRPALRTSNFTRAKSNTDLFE